VMGQKAVTEDKAKVFGVDKIIAREVYADAYYLQHKGEKRGVWKANDTDSFLLMELNGLSILLSVDKDMAVIQLEGTADHLSTWTADNKGGAHFTLLQKDDTVVSGLWNYAPNSGTAFILMDKNGNERAILGRSGTVSKKTGVSHQRPESSLVLVDEKGTVLHQVP